MDLQSILPTTLNNPLSPRPPNLHAAALEITYKLRVIIFVPIIDQICA